MTGRPADAVLAHYGGAPEVLTIAMPIVIFTVFMLLERRARRRERERAEQQRQTEPEPPA